MSQYELFITPRAWGELKELPGHMRQRVRRDIDSLRTLPRPSQSKALVLPETEAETGEAPTYELRRLRIDRWRVVYAITEAEAIIDVLTIQKRPPYDYGDLSELLENM